MNLPSSSAKRVLIGILALVCLAAAAGIWFFTRDPEQSPLLAAVTRVGIVLAALWLAWPAQGESVAWEKVAPVLVVALVLVAVTRRAFPYVLPAAIVFGLALAFLRPRKRRARH